MKKYTQLLSLFTAFMAITASSLSADNIRITVESTAPGGGVTLTPIWFGFHDGNFDTFNAGAPASAGLEAIAEDGNGATLRADFAASSGGKDLVLTGRPNPNGPPLLFPQTGNMTRINLDPSNPNHRYMSFLSMILPSNDAFIGNDDPMGLMIYDANGNFVGGTWEIMGSMVYDAGTEVNDEVAENVPMLGQTVANTGGTENGVVTLHPGFNPGGAILAFAPNGDFKQANYAVVRIIVEKLPESHRTLEIEISNSAPDMGTILTPFWVGLHDGSFDIFNVGEAASGGVEGIAEDGNTGPLSDLFAASVANGWSSTLTGPQNPGGPPLFFQGQSSSSFVSVDANNPSHEYFSYQSMILPSNDAFVSNDNPTAYRIYEGGIFQPTTIMIEGANVWDAGTEVNDEAPQNVPVLGQMAPNTGATEGGVVGAHPGFIAGGNVLTQFPAADFTQAGYQVAKIQIWERYNPWAGIPASAEGYRGSPVFGIANDSGFPWVKHLQHGMLFFQRAGNAEGFWTFNSQGDMGWIFTSESYYPNIYRMEDSTWYRYEVDSANPRRFENLSTGEILEVE
ncbi:MAG: spondin domain-containing protein [Opitutales bacterium]|nr:spondin domain-containing protein [Opitutales bacterium]